MNNKKIKVLLIEDSDTDAGIVQDVLAKSQLYSYSVVRTTTLQDGVKETKNALYDVALLDLKLPDSHGLNTLHEFKNQEPNVATIIFTLINDTSVGVNAIKNGAEDYITKDTFITLNLEKSILYSIQRKLAMNEITTLKEELERSNKELEQFAYIASHDLKEPLRMISSYVQLLEKKYKDKLDNNAKEYIGFAVDGATRMSKLIDNLLDYSRVGTKKIEIERVNINEVLKEVLKSLERKIIETQAKIKCNELPEITGDKVQLHRLFQNLIGNAIKFTKNCNPEVVVEARQDQALCLFSIKDNGIGVSKENQGKLFQIFTRLYTEEKYEGSGIGLAVCKKIVERHGGKIWVESDNGHGSTFCFTIPVNANGGLKGTSIGH